MGLVLEVAVRGREAARPRGEKRAWDDDVRLVAERPAAASLGSVEFPAPEVACG